MTWFHRLEVINLCQGRCQVNHVLPLHIYLHFSFCIPYYLATIIRTAIPPLSIYCVSTKYWKAPFPSLWLAAVLSYNVLSKDLWHTKRNGGEITSNSQHLPHTRPTSYHIFSSKYYSNKMLWGNRKSMRMKELLLI